MTLPIFVSSHLKIALLTLHVKRYKNQTIKPTEKVFRIESVPLNPEFPTLNSLQIIISIIGVVVRHNREVKY